MVQLEGATELEIAALSLAKDGNETGDAMLERNAHVRLRRGELVISQERTDVTAVPDLVVETGAGKLLSRFDCLVRIETGVGATRLLCVSGTAAFEPRGGGSVPLTPGEFMEWREGKRPTTTTADATPSGQRIITDALEEATRLQTLRDRLRDVLPK